MCYFGSDTALQHVVTKVIKTTKLLLIPGLRSTEPVWDIHFPTLISL